MYKSIGEVDKVNMIESIKDIKPNKDWYRSLDQQIILHLIKF